MGVSTEIFDFWRRIGRGENIHPADRKVFERIASQRHGFRLGCLPACFTGPLLTAPVVLLYLSPGYAGTEETRAKTASTRDYYWRKWRGREPLPDGDGPGARWAKAHTRRFGDYAKVRKKVAIFDIGAYHSTKMESLASMLALPSSRVALNWAQNYLFPEAEAGRRIVVCMRSAAYWGLEPEKRYRGTLFAPRTNRSGYLLKTPENRNIILRIRRAVEV